MAKLKGGRGYTAPYQTTHIRVPVALKGKLQCFVDEWVDLVLDGLIDPSQVYEDLHKLDKDGKLAIIQAKYVLKKKQSARVSMAELVNRLYGTSYQPKDLSD